MLSFGWFAEPILRLVTVRFFFTGFGGDLNSCFNSGMSERTHERRCALPSASERDKDEPLDTLDSLSARLLMLTALDPSAMDCVAGVLAGTGGWLKLDVSDTVAEP